MSALVWILGLGAVGVGAYALSKGSSSPSTPPTATQALQQQASAATASAQAFNSQAQALGLTQDQAQAAYDTGLSPAEYAEGVLGSTTSTATPPSPSGGTPDLSSGAPILSYHGECVDPETCMQIGAPLGTPVYRDVHTGAPMVVDSFGQPWLLAVA